MRFLITLGLTASFLAGCAQCSPGRPTADVNINVGTGGIGTGVSVGKQCGPINFSVGGGKYYHPNW